MARNAALRRAGPPVVAGLALLLGGITVWYAWVVARHLRDDARQTSTLLGRVFAGLNDPRPDAATDALLDLARQVRSLGIAIVVMDTAGHITALDNAPPQIGADTAQLRAWISELDVENPPLVQPGVGTIHYGTGTAARRFASIAALEGAVLLCLALLAGWAYRSPVAAERDRRALGTGRADRRGRGSGRPHRPAERDRRRARRAAGGAGPAVRAGRLDQAGGLGHRPGPGAAHRRATARWPLGVPASPDRRGSRIRARIPAGVTDVTTCDARPSRD